MATRIAHRAKLLAMDLTITAMQHTRSSELLSGIVRRLYHLITMSYYFYPSLQFLCLGSQAS